MQKIVFEKRNYFPFIDNGIKVFRTSNGKNALLQDGKSFVHVSSPELLKLRKVGDITFEEVLQNVKEKLDKF